MTTNQLRHLHFKGIFFVKSQCLILDSMIFTNFLSFSISARSSKSSLTSVDSTVSSKSYPGRVVKRKNSDRRYAGKPRSPSERKIGIVRRRSQEMAHKKSLIRDDKNKLKYFGLFYIYISKNFVKGKYSICKLFDLIAMLSKTCPEWSFK